MNNDRQARVVGVSLRKTAIAAGVLFLITHVTSVASAFLYGPVLNNPGFITGPGPDTGVLVGALFEAILAMAIIGTAVALYPVVKRENEGVAMGYVGLRTLEGAIIAAGAVPMLVVVALRQQASLAAATLNGGADAATLVTLGSGLVSFHNWTFILGPGLVCGVNTVLMAYLMYRARLVPRFIPVLGLVGGPVIFAYNTALIFGLGGAFPAWAGILVIPIFAWEVSLALYMIFKGFRPAAVAEQRAKAKMQEAFSLS